MDIIPDPYIIAGLISLAIILAQVIKILVDRRWPAKNGGCSAAEIVAAQCRWDHDAAEKLQSIYKMSTVLNDTIAGRDGMIAITTRLVRELDTISHRLDTGTVAQNNVITLLERLLDRVPTQ